jgi:hypothetical protein
VEPAEIIVLKTAIVSVVAQKGVITANAIIDEGSQRTLITRKLAKLLKIKNSSQEYLLLSGSTGLSCGPQMYEVIEFALIDGEGDSLFIKVIVVDKVAKPLEDSNRRRINSLPHLRVLDLAHPTVKRKVFQADLILGVDFYWSIVQDEKPIRVDGPVAVRSKIGYLVSGPLTGIASQHPSQISSLHITAVEEVDVSCLWSLESLGINPQTENMEEAAEYAKENISYQDGRYVAKFPWKKEHPELP